MGEDLVALRNTANSRAGGRITGTVDRKRTASGSARLAFAMLRLGGTPLSSSDRRTPYRSPVRIALDHRAETRPAPFRFVEAQARDLSGRGISLVAPAKPDTDWLVVELGCPPDQIFLRCRVVSAQAAEDDGLTLLDCEFCGRL